VLIVAEKRNKSQILENNAMYKFDIFASITVLQVYVKDGMKIACVVTQS
jgi:hypothetical protein